MDFNKLTTADRVVGISAAVFLVIVSSFPGTARAT